MKGDITIDKMSGVVYRDGKVLGRKNFIVQMELTHYETKEVIVKAIDEAEAEEITSEELIDQLFKEIPVP